MIVAKRFDYRRNRRFQGGERGEQGSRTKAVAGILADGQQQGALRNDLNPRIVARALWGGLDGIALTWALGGDPDPTSLRKAAQQYATVLLEGLHLTRCVSAPKSAGNVGANRPVTIAQHAEEE